jgi:gliding motility-associated lipoprotein GldD
MKKVMLQKSRIITILLLIIFFSSCREVVVPRPKGHFRIDLPKKEYLRYDYLQSKIADLPFTFEYPSYGQLSFQVGESTQPGWFNIDFPKYRAKIYLTYKIVNHDFQDLMDQTYTMNVKNHITKADAINEQVFNNKENNVYGILYDLKGNTASAVQFYATDSIRNYLRGSLYFSAEPDADSLAPVIEFFREDIIHLMESLKWKK